MSQAFKWNKPKKAIISGLGFNAAFELAVAENMARRMNPYVPMQTGALSQDYETGVNANGGYVKYTSPYAHRQYNGDWFNFSKEQHPLATSHWDKYMMQADGVQVTREVDRLRKRFSY